METKSNQIVLLTGAGFTKNFGGFLGSEMWQKIFNNPSIQNQERIKGALLNQEDFDFESVYSQVLNGKNFRDEEKSLLKRAVEESYEALDAATRGWVFNSDNPSALNIYGLGNFFNLFVGNSGQKGFIFTLNQDIFVERRWGHRTPGAKFSGNFYATDNRQPLKRENFAFLPSDGEMGQAHSDIQSMGGLVYIKLHGSYGWLSANRESQMVIGTDKENDIQKEPLLKWFFELFRSVIKEGSKKLVVLGYGFRDKHINQILLDGVKNYGLKLYIISPSSPYQFKENLRNGHYYAMPLWESLGGYFSYTLREIFPPDQSKTSYIDEILKTLKA